MLKVLTGIAAIVAVVLLGVSATVNFMFSSSLGRTPTEGLVLGILAVGVDVLKAVLACLLAYAMRERRWVFAGVGGLCFCVFTTVSLVSAFGFSASNRHGVIGEREQIVKRLAAIETRIAETRLKLKSVPTHRPLAVIDEALAAARVDVRWQATQQCAVVANARAREFCAGTARLREERAAAQETARLDQQLATQEAEADKLRHAGGGLVTDPQARALGQAFGVSEDQVSRGLMALLAFVLEIGSGLGVYIALGHGLGSKPIDQREQPNAEALVAPMKVAPKDPAPLPEPPSPQVPTELPPPIVAPPPAVAIGVRIGGRGSRRNGRAQDDAAKN